MSRLRFLVGLFVLVGNLSAAELPRFEDYRVSGTFTGKPAAPVLNTPHARKFRTVLRRAAASGPNCAGHFTLARWGCGAGCIAWALIEARSGIVWLAPFTVWDAATAADQEVASRSLWCRLDSELITASGALDGGRAGNYYYRWHNGELSLVHSTEYENGFPVTPTGK